MFGFGRKRKVQSGTAETFVEATGGGWGAVDDTMPADGGGRADYVGEILRCASEYAKQQNVGIGEEFSYTITDIPHGIDNPYEIIFGLMMRAPEYGLSPGPIHDETAIFIRLE